MKLQEKIHCVLQTVKFSPKMGKIRRKTKRSRAPSAKEIFYDCPVDGCTYRSIRKYNVDVQARSCSDLRIIYKCPSCLEERSLLPDFKTHVLCHDKADRPTTCIVVGRDQRDGKHLLKLLRRKIFIIFYIFYSDFILI